MHVYLYDFVPDGPVTNSVPESGVLIMPTGQELRSGGMDGQSPELISVTLQRTTTRGPLRLQSHTDVCPFAMAFTGPVLPSLITAKWRKVM
jgi:hypothetical protein